MAALEDTMWWYQALHDRLIDRLRRLQLHPGARVLDAGCGTGGLLRRLSRELPGFEYTGVERDAEAVRIADGKGTSSVVTGDVNELPFDSDHFQAIVSADVLCHREVDAKAALREFHRCLQPGGALILNLPAYNWLKTSHDLHVHNERRYTATEAKQLVESSGLRASGAGYWNTLLFPLILFYRLTAGRGKKESDVRAFPPWQDRLFYAATLAEQRLARRGVRPPFGGSVWITAVKP